MEVLWALRTFKPLSFLRTTFQDLSYNVPCCRVSVPTPIVWARGKNPRTTLAGRAGKTLQRHRPDILVPGFALWQLCAGHLRVCRMWSARSANPHTAATFFAWPRTVVALLELHHDRSSNPPLPPHRHLRRRIPGALHQYPKRTQRHGRVCDAPFCGRARSGRHLFQSRPQGHFRL